MKDVLYDKLPYSIADDIDVVMSDEGVVETCPYHMVDANFNGCKEDVRSPMPLIKKN